MEGAKGFCPFIISGGNTGWLSQYKIPQQNPFQTNLGCGDSPKKKKKNSSAGFFIPTRAPVFLLKKKRAPFI